MRFLVIISTSIPCGIDYYIYYEATRAFADKGCVGPLLSGVFNFQDVVMIFFFFLSLLLVLFSLRFICQKQKKVKKGKKFS